MSRPLQMLAVVLMSGLLGASSDKANLMKHTGAVALAGVEGRFDHFGVDSEGKRLYVAALGNNSLEVIDIATNQRAGSIPGLKKPTGVRVLHNSRNVVVASGEDGMVRVFGPDLKLIGSVKDLDDADNVRLDAEGKLAYVGYGDGAIAIIDPVACKKVGDVKLDGHPEAFQLEKKGNRIFANVPTAKQVAVIDRDRRAVAAKWPVREAEANFPMALDEANHRLFIGCRKPARVLVLDMQTGKTVAAVECCGDTDDLFYDAAAAKIYLTGGEGCISVIKQSDADHYHLVGNQPTAPGARTSLFIPETRLLYVAVPHRGGGQPAEIRIYQDALHDPPK